jgi:hypothetical protein
VFGDHFPGVKSPVSKFCFLVAVTVLLSLRVSVFPQNVFQDMGVNHTVPKNKLLGFDKYGIDIIVEDYREKYKNFPNESIRNQVELRLRQGKIKVNNDSSCAISCNFLPQRYSNNKFSGTYAYDIYANRPVTYTVDGISYMRFGIPVWRRSGVVSEEGVRDVINETLDEFLLELLKSREEHEKNKKELAAKNKSAAKPSSATPTKK